MQPLHVHPAYLPQEMEGVCALAAAYAAGGVCFELCCVSGSPVDHATWLQSAERNGKMPPAAVRLGQVCL